MERLRGRDLKGSINKCYSIYYKNDKTVSADSGDQSEPKVSVKSPRKRNSSEVLRNVDRRRQQRRGHVDDELDIRSEVDNEKYTKDFVDNDNKGADEVERESEPKTAPVYSNTANNIDWKVMPFGLFNGIQHGESECSIETVATLSEDNNNSKEDANLKQQLVDSEEIRKRRLSGSDCQSVEDGAAGKRFKFDVVKDMMFQVGRISLLTL